jgi:hypothetical protein
MKQNKIEMDNSPISCYLQAGMESQGDNHVDSTYCDHGKVDRAQDAVMNSQDPSLLTQEGLLQHLREEGAAHVVYSVAEALCVDNPLARMDSSTLHSAQTSARSCAPGTFTAPFYASDQVAVCLCRKIRSMLQCQLELLVLDAVITQVLQQTENTKHCDVWDLAQVSCRIWAASQLISGHR